MNINAIKNCLANSQIPTIIDTIEARVENLQNLIEDVATPESDKFIREIFGLLHYLRLIQKDPK